MPIGPLMAYEPQIAQSFPCTTTCRGPFGNDDGLELWLTEILRLKPRPVLQPKLFPLPVKMTEDSDGCTAPKLNTVTLSLYEYIIQSFKNSLCFNIATNRENFPIRRIVFYDKTKGKQIRRVIRSHNLNNVVKSSTSCN